MMLKKKSKKKGETFFKNNIKIKQKDQEFKKIQFPYVQILEN